MTVGELTVDLKLNAEEFKAALADAIAAVEKLEEAIVRLRTVGITVGCDARP